MEEIERRLRILQLSFRPDLSATQLVEYAKVLDEYVTSGDNAPRRGRPPGKSKDPEMP